MPQIFRLRICNGVYYTSWYLTQQQSFLRWQEIKWSRSINQIKRIPINQNVQHPHGYFPVRKPKRKTHNQTSKPPSWFWNAAALNSFGGRRANSFLEAWVRHRLPTPTSWLKKKSCKSKPLRNQKPFEKSNKNQNKSNKIAFKSNLTFSGIKRYEKNKNKYILSLILLEHCNQGQQNMDTDSYPTFYYFCAVLSMLNVVWKYRHQLFRLFWSVYFTHAQSRSRIFERLSVWQRQWVLVYFDPATVQFFLVMITINREIQATV